MIILYVYEVGLPVQFKESKNAGDLGIYPKELKASYLPMSIATLFTIAKS